MKTFVVVMACYFAACLGARLLLIETTRAKTQTTRNVNVFVALEYFAFLVAACAVLIREGACR